ncbi:hypothetical protein [Paraburkholderia sp. Cpub6]|uniref:hypothetical protein n=1 Tax=Paraburkholderia sp. Cpub6 TaxID=2723094 RepID=UPI0016140D99|nr:hypothetical protein [Paraburkholderia sp. Cpub6]MBB5462349.1 hypothetical protein [Paraburkholderia sp. Cpub6]
MVTHGRDFVFFIPSFYRRLPINLTKPLPPLRRLSLYLLRAVNEGVMSCASGECGRSARPVRVNRAVVETNPVTQPNAAARGSGDGRRPLSEGSGRRAARSDRKLLAAGLTAASAMRDERHAHKI